MSSHGTRDWVDIANAARRMLAARDAVEEGTVSFDLHNDAVAELESAEAELRTLLDTVDDSPHSDDLQGVLAEVVTSLPEPMPAGWSVLPATPVKTEPGTRVRVVEQ